MASQVIQSDTRFLFAHSTGMMAKDPRYDHGEILISNQFSNVPNPSHPYNGDFVCVKLYDWTTGVPVEVTPLNIKGDGPIDNPFVVAPNSSIIIELPNTKVPAYYEIRIATEVEIQPDVIANIIAYDSSNNILDVNTFVFEELSPQHICAGSIVTTVTAACNCTRD